MPEPLRVLVVCTANICRSPAAAAILRLALPQSELFQIRSAGVAAVPGATACEVSGAWVEQQMAGADRPPPAVSQTTEPVWAGADRGATTGGGRRRTTASARREPVTASTDREIATGHLSKHVARLATDQDVAWADLVLALDRSHRAALAHLAPSTRSRTFTLRQAGVLSDAVRVSLAVGDLPPGAPAMPPDASDRLRWFVGELDAVRGTVVSQAPEGDGWHADEVPDPHVLGGELHVPALELIQESVAQLAAGFSAVLGWTSLAVD